MTVAQWMPQYHQKVLSLDGLIAYWMLDEKQGTVAWDQVTLHGAAAARHGAHVGVTLYQEGIGDQRPSPFYDGALDYTDAFTPSLQAAFNGAEGSVLAWARVANAGVWTDGAFRVVVRFRADANNYLDLLRWNVNNQFDWRYVASGVVEQVSLGGLTTVDWFSVALTWSASAGANGEVWAYYNGIQTGATQVALGVWAGNLLNTATVIGAGTTVPNSPWHGYEAHVALLNRPATPEEVRMAHRWRFA